jgi:hypothetical protein
MSAYDRCGKSGVAGSIDRCFAGVDLHFDVLETVGEFVGRFEDLAAQQREIVVMQRRRQQQILVAREVPMLPVDSATNHANDYALSGSADPAGNVGGINCPNRAGSHDSSMPSAGGRDRGSCRAL